MVQIEDSRPQSERIDFPWWWRDESLPIHKQLEETYEEAFALEYELRRRHGFESQKPPKTMRKGWCSLIETWDLWAANIYSEKQFPADSDSHRRSADRAEASGKKHSEFAK